MKMRTIVLFAVSLALSTAGQAQGGPVKKSCGVNAAAPSEAELALSTDPARAETLYLAMPPSSATTAGVIRAKLAQKQLDEALKMAQGASSAHPDDPVLLNALGEVRFRRGEVADASAVLLHSLAIDACAGRTHFDISRFQQLNGNYASADKELNFAHALSPKDPVVTRAWSREHREHLTSAQQVVALQQRASANGVSEEEKQHLDAEISYEKALEQGSCKLTEPVTSTKIPLLTMNNAVSDEGSHSSGLEISFNGKKRHLLLDTGASGLSLTKAAATALGLTPQARISIGGFGEEGRTGGYLTHVDSIRVGGMQFQNCMVEVIDTATRTGANDGLVGPDVFRAFVVTLDFPADELRLGPLPRRPNEAAETATLETDRSDSGGGAGGGRQDRYTAPEMKDWFPVFRHDHLLIVPTSIGKGINKLFVMDTGSELNLISPEAAREVGHVTADDSEMMGLSGKSKTMFNGGAVTLTFANIRQPASGLLAVKLPDVVDGEVEVSGFLGYQSLRQLKIEIDYRDNLVRFTFSPHIDRSNRNVNGQ